jgi:poly(ADP-ribose) glycohydrolase ARH3
MSHPQERTYDDAVEIDDGLWVGSHPDPDDPFELGADVVVTLTLEAAAKAVPPGKLLIHWPIRDGPVPRPGVLRGLVRLISDCIDDRGVVFVHCRAGMNRSCLVAGRTLMERGMTAEQAIERVRERRTGSLSDEYAAWLRFEEEARVPQSDGAETRIRAKYRGAILGVAIGDALGSAYEGTPRLLPEEIHYLLTDPHKMRYTDDTAMTIAMAESLIACEGFDPDHMAHTFSDAYWAEPGRGYAAGPPSIFEQMRSGRHWREAARSLYEGGSFGNGGAMRVSPAALFAAPDLDAVAAVARGSGEITHAHPLGMEGAELQAVALALALASDPKVPLDTNGFIDALLSRARSDDFRSALRAVAELVPFGERDEAVRRLGHGITAIEAVPVAIWCFLRNPDSFVEAVLCAITVGGDTDTIASMACAISGARLGEAAIPEIWRVRIEGRAKLLGIADALHTSAARSGAGV